VLAKPYQLHDIIQQIHDARSRSQRAVGPFVASRSGSAPRDGLRGEVLSQAASGSGTLPARGLFGAPPRAHRARAVGRSPDGVSDAIFGSSRPAPPDCCVSPSIKSLAEAGFSSASHLSRAFLAHSGTGRATTRRVRMAVCGHLRSCPHRALTPSARRSSATPTRERALDGPRRT